MADVTIHAPDGTLGTVPEEHLKEAIAAGGYLPGQRPASVTAPTPGGPLSEAELHEQIPAPADETTAGKGFALPVLMKNKETGAVEPVQPADVQQALAAGTYDVADPKALIKVTAPDGTLGEVPAGNLKAALDAGGKLSSSAELERQGIEEQTKEDFGAASTAALGVASPLQDLVSAGAQAVGAISPEDRARTEQVAQVAKEEHPYAYWAGKIPAEVAVALGSGDVAEGAAGAAKLSGWGKVALEGAIYSAPTVAQKVIDKDPAGAAEALALGVGGNIGLHAVFGAVGGALNREAKPVVEGAAREEEIRVAQNTIGKELGVSPSQVVKLRENIAPLVDAAGITEKDTAQSAVKKIQALSESGPKIGKAIKSLNEFEGKAEAISTSLLKAQDELHEVVAKAIKVGDEQTAKALEPIDKRISALSRNADVSFDDTQDLKSWLGKQTNWADNGVVNGARRDAYAIIRKNIMDAENVAAENVGGSAVVEGLKADRATYALDQMFGQFADKTGAKEVFESPLQHAHIRRHGAAGMLAHAVFGHVAAPIAIGLSVGEMALRKGLRDNVFGNAVKALKGSAEPNTSLALDAIKSIDDHIGAQVKQLMSSLVARELSKHTDVIDSGISKFLPNSGNGQSHPTQVKVLKRAAMQYRTDPGTVTDHLAQMTAPLRQEGLHNVADAYTEHQLRLMKVIDSVLPDDPAMAKAHPFASSVAPEDVSPAAKARYTRALSIASDPTKLLGLVKANAISPTDVAIAAATNPSTLAKMRTALVDDAMSRKPDLTYQHRISMAILMGTYLDESTRQLPVLQSAFLAPPPSGTTGTPKPIKTDEKQTNALAQAYLPDSAKGIVSSR